ncbi:MAG: class I SAM-dependent methyltransferase [Patescibacteria group bacterium]
MEITNPSDGLYDLRYGEAQARDIPQEYKNLALEWLKPKRDDVVLEVGMGSGDMLEFLRQYSDNVIGVDINKDFLQAHPKEKIAAMDARRLAVRDGVIDKSISLHTLEHIPQVDEVIRELDRVTKEGGLCFLVFPNPRFHPAEGALTEATRLTKNPFKIWGLAKKLHPIDLTPDLFRASLEGTNWTVDQFENIHVPVEKGYSWGVLLRKRTQ